MLDSKVSGGLYSALGVDVKGLKKSIAAEITRGIASGMSYADIARNISNVSKAPLSRAKTIARTEGHRIQQASTRDAQRFAKSKGVDVVKQWDATLDGKTRDSHRAVDGEIRELDEKFSNGLEYPGDPNGPAAEVINCRCVSLSRARGALDADELKTLRDRAAFFGLDKSANFENFKKKYLKASAAPLEKSLKSSTMKLGNTEVRQWYVDKASRIADGIDKSLPMEEQARQAFEARNRLRTEAREMMADEDAKEFLDTKKPNKSFEELIKSKMKRKGMSREEAIQDVYDTATKTNANVNKKFGIGGE